jgi:3-oxosteroid 1-dehydrogenase
MIADYKRTGGANVPCWMIFDATYRRHYTCGGLMPSTVAPDSRVPANVWDNYIFRADTLGALAAKIGVPADALKAEVERNNRHAAAGKDDDFARGGTEYETYNAGDPRVKPNPCLGPIDTAPYYAVQVDLGDVGSKGGLKANANAQVLGRDGAPIDGLYAVGNAAGSPFGNNYPGGGGTLGPATVFGFIAADHLAEQGQELGRHTHNIRPPS